jgi:hypothetical protein
VPGVIAAMKIILSRKGFDSSIGKVPSPIFPSGELRSLPIPDHDQPVQASTRCYKDIRAGYRSLAALVDDLTNGVITPDCPVHLDPDLALDSVPRLPGWKPVFGQAGAAERHLQNQGVGAGDIFVFYGWFRNVVEQAGRYRYVPEDPGRHVIFGWLQIEQRIPVDDRARIPVWARDHAHCCRAKRDKLDSLYISTDRITLPNATVDKPGAGIFPCFHPDLCLTAPGSLRSIWRLPAWMYPAAGRSGLSYHRNLQRWTAGPDHVLLQTVGRGQEFVLDCDGYPEALDWLAAILRI